MSYNFITSGIDGDLVILSGQTIDVAEGTVKQYNSIRIDSGGTLRITGNVGLWTEIGCKNDCIINGQIISRSGYDGESTHAGGTFAKTSNFGLGNLSYTITQVNGGNGGGGGSFGGTGGTQLIGIGGGGGGGGGTNNFGGNGGNGGSNGASTIIGTGGIGGGFLNGENAPIGTPYARGGNGASGGGAGNQGSLNYGIMGGGGGGGYKGHHGKGLVLFVEGIISGLGNINCSGRSGFNGGNGAPITFGTTSKSGGGGGGAGGSGGSIIIRYNKVNSIPNLLVDGGSGGIGGTKLGDGSNGGNGSLGNNGSYSIKKIGE